MNQLTKEEKEFWNQHRYLVISNFFNQQEKSNIENWTEELEAWEETPGKWMKYFEKSSQSDRQLCRVENFLPYHEGIRGMLLDPMLLNLVSELMGEKAILFKEKINFKLPGGGGFAPHQDAPAFKSFNQHYHITMMIPVDAATPENGCLQVVKNYGKEEMLDQKEDGTIADHEVARFEWSDLETKPGEVVFFDSYLPHRSSENRSDKERKAFFITFNRESEGDRREDYYAHKREVFPPDCEREEGKVYDGGGIYNLGNPIR